MLQVDYLVEIVQWPCLITKEVLITMQIYLHSSQQDHFKEESSLETERKPSIRSWALVWLEIGKLRSLNNNLLDSVTFRILDRFHNSSIKWHLYFYSIFILEGPRSLRLRHFFHFQLIVCCCEPCNKITLRKRWLTLSKCLFLGDSFGSLLVFN